MADRGPDRPQVFTIPSHRAFADSLAAGLIRRFARRPLDLAQGRILLPNNRALRTLTEAFVRESGGGLLLPRMIAIGDPELGERIGGSLDPIGDDEPLPAIEPDERLLLHAAILRGAGRGTAEAMRLAAELGRTIDALQIEDVDVPRLIDAVSQSPDLAEHWQKSLEQLQLILRQWPQLLADRGQIDPVERRNLLLRRLAASWADSPPSGFTIAAGITTAAPAVAALVARVARLPEGSVVLPGLWLADQFPEAEWEALTPADGGRGETTHPQYHLKQLLDRMGVAREEVQSWTTVAGAASSPARSRAAVNAFAAPRFSHKWETLPRGERRFAGVRLAALPDAAAEAQAIALAMREALETPGKTAALVTPDRRLAARVSALLKRWEIEADDSAGQPLSTTAPASLILAIVAVAAEDFAPVPVLALLKHPLVGGEGESRRAWLDDVRDLDLRLRGPRPAPGLTGLDDAFAGSSFAERWDKLRQGLEPIAGMLGDQPSLSVLANRLVAAAQALAGEGLWRGNAGRLVVDLLAELETSPSAHSLPIAADDALALLRDWLDRGTVRPPYGQHPRLFIWGLLEARMQRADLMILGGLNEDVWPALPAPDPWLPPPVRAALGMPTLDSRIGLSAHDFASALGAPEVLITRARRDGRSPTVASRFWLRLRALDPDVDQDDRLAGWAAAIDDPGEVRPADRPEPAPASDRRPRTISVTAVDRLRADPFAFYARSILRLRPLDPVDADATAAWKGNVAHELFEDWLKEDDCCLDALVPRAERMFADAAVHPRLRALWQPRLMEGVRWVADAVDANRVTGREPSEAELEGAAEIAGVHLSGTADRIDRYSDGGVALVDYKTGQPPTVKAAEEGYALQLGLLGLIAEAGGFTALGKATPSRFEYWSLARKGEGFGHVVRPDKNLGPEAFLDHARAHFARAVSDWLTGMRPFTAKLNPAYAPYGEYNQLMRLEEWYGRK